ncbi:MAG: hypothetical protein NUW00_03560 [Candidatus Kaiserbacteria bacterium]|nr:hypothetical protein [Candidatus Kaiserbacteria bacterium]MCR4330419.1 hypothetical protein [Patescibacteria group bacterium]
MEIQEALLRKQFEIGDLKAELRMANAECRRLETQVDTWKRRWAHQHLTTLKWMDAFSMYKGFIKTLTGACDSGALKV